MWQLGRRTLHLLNSKQLLITLFSLAVPYRVHNHWGSHDAVAPSYEEIPLIPEQAPF